jgi:hypothetical protein
VSVVLKCDRDVLLRSNIIILFVVVAFLSHSIRLGYLFDRESLLIG